jgi:hypothetical protein
MLKQTIYKCKRRARQETVTAAEAEANMQNAKQEAMMEQPSN